MIRLGRHRSSAPVTTGAVDLRAPRAAHACSDRRRTRRARCGTAAAAGVDAARSAKDRSAGTKSMRMRLKPAPSLVECRCCRDGRLRLSACVNAGSRRLSRGVVRAASDCAAATRSQSAHAPTPPWQGSDGLARCAAIVAHACASRICCIAAGCLCMTNGGPEPARMRPSALDARGRLRPPCALPTCLWNFHDHPKNRCHRVHGPAGR